MAIKRTLTKAVPVQLTPEWYDRVKTIADHERVNVSLAQVIRDAIEVALPGFELELGLVDAEETVTPAVQTGGLSQADLDRLHGKEDRSAGCFGGPPKPE